MIKMNNDFETYINRLIKVINDYCHGIGWKNHPERTKSGKYLKGEVFDFIILSKDYKCCFDAKMTHSDKYRICKKDINQANNLLLSWKAGIDAFFLIYFFNERNYRKLDILTFYEILKDRKYITYKDCKNFKLERMFLHEKKNK